MSLLALTLHYQGQRNTGFMIHYGSLKFDLIMNQMANLSIVLLYPIWTVLRANPAQPTDEGNNDACPRPACCPRLIYMATTSHQKATRSYSVYCNLLKCLGHGNCIIARLK